MKVKLLIATAILASSATAVFAGNVACTDGQCNRAVCNQTEYFCCYAGDWGSNLWVVNHGMQSRNPNEIPYLTCRWAEDPYANPISPCNSTTDTFQQWPDGNDPKVADNVATCKFYKWTPN